MQANIFWKNEVFENVELKSINDCIVAFDVKNEQLTDYILDVLIDEKANIGFYSDCVHVILRRKDVTNIEW